MKQFIKKVGKGHAENKERERFSDFVSYVTLLRALRARASDRPACVGRARVRVRVRVCARASARGSTYGRRGQTDRDKEHFRTRAGRDQGPRICCCWQGEAQENPRERVTPECPRFLLSVPSLLSLAHSVPLALTRVPQSSPSLPGPLAPSLSPSRSRRATPHPMGYTISLFFSTSSVLPSCKWRAPSLVVSCPTVSCDERRVFLSIGTIEYVSKIIRDRLGERKCGIE